MKSPHHSLKAGAQGWVWMWLRSTQLGVCRSRVEAGVSMVPDEQETSCLGGSSLTSHTDGLFIV